MYRTLSSSSDSAGAPSEQPDPSALELSVEAPTAPGGGDVAGGALSGRRRISQRILMDSNVLRAGHRWRRRTRGDKDIEAPRWFEHIPFSWLDERKVFVPIYAILVLAIPLNFAGFLMEELALDDPYDPVGCVQIRSAQVKALYAFGFTAFAIVWPVWFNSLRQVVRLESNDDEGSADDADDAAGQQPDSPDDPERGRASSGQANLRDSAGSARALNETVEHVLEVRRVAESFALAHKIRCGDISQKEAENRRSGVSPSSPRDSVGGDEGEIEFVRPGALSVLRKSGEGTTTMIKPKQHKSLLTSMWLMVLLCVMLYAAVITMGYSLLTLLLTDFHQREGAFKEVDQ